MPPDPSVHVGVGAVVRQYNKVLLVQRGGSGRFASDGHGTWSVPGGWLEYGESPMEAAVREVYEETGVTTGAIDGSGWVCCKSDSDPIQIVTLFIECAYITGEPTITEPEKCPQVEWVPFRELDDRPLFTPLREWRNRTGQLRSYSRCD